MNGQNIFDKQINEWLENEIHVADYREAMRLLVRSQVLPLLQRIGIPNRPHLGSDPNIMAAEGNFVSGYQTALEHMRFFEETFRKSDVSKALGIPTYNGDNLALLRGDLTKEEIEQ